MPPTHDADEEAPPLAIDGAAPMTIAYTVTRWDRVRIFLFSLSRSSVALLLFAGVCGIRIHRDLIRLSEGGRASVLAKIIVYNVAVSMITILAIPLVFSYAIPQPGHVGHHVLTVTEEALVDDWGDIRARHDWAGFRGVTDLLGIVLVDASWTKLVPIPHHAFGSEEARARFMSLLGSRVELARAAPRVRSGPKPGELSVTSPFDRNDRVLMYMRLYLRSHLRWLVPAIVVIRTLVDFWNGALAWLSVGERAMAFGTSTLTQLLFTFGAVFVSILALGYLTSGRGSLGTHAITVTDEGLRVVGAGSDVTFKGAKFYRTFNAGRCLYLWITMDTCFAIRHSGFASEADRVEFERLVRERGGLPPSRD